MEPSEKHMFKYKGAYFISDQATPDYLDSLEEFVIREDDVFQVTYPKSGKTKNISLRKDLISSFHFSLI